PPTFLKRPVVSSMTSCLTTNTDGITLAGTYTRFVFGLNVIGAHAFPPELPGDTRIGRSQNAEKMQPRSKSLSGSAQSGTKRSPMGYGCVLAVFCRGSCGTAFSSTPMRGVPFVRSRMYSQPVLPG